MCLLGCLVPQSAGHTVRRTAYNAASLTEQAADTSRTTSTEITKRVIGFPHHQQSLDGRAPVQISQTAPHPH